jgi:Leucine-rich repeat (LRR) protein
MQLTSLPASICTITSLRTLDISHNMLTQLPDRLDQLIHLEYLVAVANQLTTTGLSCGGTGPPPRLLGLYLSRNQLSAVPGRLVTDCPGLRELYLDHNRIAVLPAGLTANLTRLAILSLAGNRLAWLPPLPFISCPRSIIDI